uniref:AB hydrolase-1 domain-containing protein n=1 Tax=Psilocybe cubensis TaxID=181762 RepID=A0A8H7XP57_PSICU
MPTITAKDVVFHYTDSGLPTQCEEYSTLFVIHGHSFHSGIFSTLFPVASKESLRVICLDRREYQGSTPYTAEELRIIHEGTDAERLDLLTFEGVYLALGIEGLIRELDLPPGSGDPPFQVLGLDSPPEYYSPLWDDDIPEGDRGSAFAHWISSYFNHDMEALAQRDPSKLNKRHPSSKKPTAERMTIDELVAVTDFRPGPKCDTAFGGPGYHTAQRLNYQNALFGAAPNSRNWHLRNVVHLYGVESAWSIIYTVWVLEDEDKTTKRIEFKAIQGVNHFVGPVLLA